MYCKKCGSQLDDTAKSCPSCGEIVQNDEKSAKSLDFTTLMDDLKKVGSVYIDKWKHIKATEIEGKKIDFATLIDGLKKAVSAYIEKWKHIGAAEIRRKRIWYGIHGGAAALILIVLIAVSGRGEKDSVSRVADNDVLSNENVSEVDVDNFANIMDDISEDSTIMAGDISWAYIGDWWYEKCDELFENDMFLDSNYNYQVLDPPNGYPGGNYNFMISNRTWYDKDGFVLALAKAREELIEGQNSRPEDSVSRMFRSFDDLNEGGTESFGIAMVSSSPNRMELVARHPGYWESLKMLYYPLGSMEFEELEGNIIRFYCYDNKVNRRPYLDVSYAFQPNTGILIFTLNDKDYTLMPYYECKEYQEALKAYESSFTNLSAGKSWEMNADFFERVASTTAIGCGDMGFGTGSSTLYFGLSSVHMQTSNKFCNAHWGESTVPGQIIIKADGGYPIYANYSFSATTLTLTIDGTSYSFKEIK